MMDSDLAFLLNSTATYEQIEQNGLPSNPLDFDNAIVGRAERVEAPVYNPSSHEVLTVSNIIYERHLDGRPPTRAYWVGRKLKKCIFGVVKSCIILKFRNHPDIPWEVTEEKAAVKIMSWDKIREIQHIEDPRKEVAAMQHMSRIGQHPHVMGALDVLQDEDYLLLFMPFCNSGDLFGFVQQAGRFPEPMARYWFKQILDGLSHLQRLGVCHRDLSLENILVNEYKTSIVIDLGMCLRVPHALTEETKRQYHHQGHNDNHSNNFHQQSTGNNSSDNMCGYSNESTDVSAGTLRKLIKPMMPCGKPNYISPEILDSKVPFDGYAIDLWSTGIILFIMLVGLPPWEFARSEDPRYTMVVLKGQLHRMLNNWQRNISPLAGDLLQKMLTENPRHRLSLEEVKAHPWVNEDVETKPTAPTNEGWRG